MSWPNNLDRPALGMRIPRLIMRGFYNWRYFRGVTPWDTHITPPEVVQLVEQENFPPGRALDLGCGTGTNALYLAKRGFDVIGVDYVSRAIETAKQKAKAQMFAKNFFMTTYADDGKSAWYRWVKK